MTTTNTATVTADAFLAAAEVAERIAYRWETVLLARLARDGQVSATYPSFYVSQDGRLLKGWQVARFVDAGLMKRKVEYADWWPKQSMFDAPVEFSGYEITELGRMVATIVAGRTE